MLLTSMIMGAKIRTMWMTPYLFAGTFVIYIFKSQINLNKLKRFYCSICIFISYFTIYLCICFNYKTDKRTDFPGKEKADEIQVHGIKNTKVK